MTSTRAPAASHGAARRTARYGVMPASASGAARTGSRPRSATRWRGWGPAWPRRTRRRPGSPAPVENAQRCSSPDGIARTRRSPSRRTPPPGRRCSGARGAAAGRLRADLVDPAGHLVAERARQLDPRLGAVDDVEVGVADAAPATRTRTSVPSGSGSGTSSRRSSSPGACRRTARIGSGDQPGVRASPVRPEAAPTGRAWRDPPVRPARPGRAWRARTPSRSTARAMGRATFTFSPPATVSTPSSSTALVARRRAAGTGARAWRRSPPAARSESVVTAGRRDAGLAQTLVAGDHGLDRPQALAAWRRRSRSGRRRRGGPPVAL